MKKTVTVLYKSGAKVRVKADNFKLIKSGSTLKSVEWENAIPGPLLLGVDEIAAVYEGRA